MQLLKAWTRLYPELVVQPAPDLAVGSQGVGLATKAEQSRHALLVQLLLQRIFGNQAVDPGKGRGVPAQSQLGLDSQSLRDQSRLLQPGGDRHCEAKICHVGQRRAAPQSQPTCQLGGRLLMGITAKRLATGLHRSCRTRRHRRSSRWCRCDSRRAR